MKIAIKNNSVIKVYNGDADFSALSQFIKKEFKLSPSQYTLTYVDEDGDNITLASNEDMSSAHELNNDKNLLKVRLNLTGVIEENEKMEFEVINEPPVVEQEIKEQTKMEEEPKVQEVHENKWHKWAWWGGHKSHHQSPSNEGHHWHGYGHGRGHGHGHEHFKMFHHMMNMKIAEQVDERVKVLIPCIKAQLQGGSFMKTFSVENPLVHENTECKSCFSTPIVGIRYKCLECPAFNLCQKCEPTVPHDHNLLKMKHVSKENSECESPFKFFKKFWKHGGHGGHRSHSSSSEKWGKQERITRKLAKIFGGEPQKYEQFTKSNKSLNKFEMINKYATENGQEDQLVNFRCEKIAQRLNKQPEELKQVVKNNLNLRPWQLVHKFTENGQETPFLFGGKCDKYQRKCEKKWEKEEKKCNKSKSKEKCHGKWRNQMPSCEQKFPQQNLSSGSSEKTEKGKILESLISLFGGSNVKEYYALIEQHFSMGQEAIINKWLETHCSKPSA